MSVQQLKEPSDGSFAGATMSEKHILNDSEPVEDIDGPKEQDENTPTAGSPYSFLIYILYWNPVYDLSSGIRYPSNI